MPGRDGTGPAGMGLMSGRRMGYCRSRASNNPHGMGLGMRSRYGCRRMMEINPETIKSNLERQKSFLEARLEDVKRMLGSFSKNEDV
ncbi:MAG: DUF5320 domain-containing protein [Bacillota bacterium]